ncbi:sigma factor-like helix-turn-helix DNA-binding protein [Nocardioides sp. URHA0020]|uniref:sigma factor-like helix-turn-helix DNA-binding protein n=1 Tax=Nocardioides sp. URHA0020 TaxID=1380392 RepID=UPI00048D8D02|nr:sigma factor-like helix-turn-helix DNA-binding protein [Nocardioides sp. URHA0020]
MPGDHADFAAYLTARWPSLVRTLVLLGCGRPEAVTLARTGLARCDQGWDRVRRADDVDVYTYATVLGCLHQHRRQVPAPAVPAVAPAWSGSSGSSGEEPTADELLLHALMLQLERLDTDEREAVVLHLVAELSESQVADVLDVPLESAQARITHGLGRLDVLSPREAFRRASEAVEVPAVPVDDVVAEARARRRRRLRLGVAGVAAAAVVVGGLAWAADRGPDDPGERDLAPVAVRLERNPVTVAWYADGRLHLDKVSVKVPAITALVELDGGAVYGDRKGTIAFVAADGQRRRIGHQDPDGRLVASTGEGWVAWVDPGDGGSDATLEVYDVATGANVATQDLRTGDVRPIAIDQGHLYFAAPDGTYSWEPARGSPRRMDRDGLVDVESANLVYQLDGSIEMEQGFFNVSFVRPGTDALISPGGVLVLSRVPGPGVATGAPFRPLLYDARSGSRKPTGVRADERAVAAAFGSNNTAVYLVAQVADLDSGGDHLLALRSCDLTDGRCTDVAPVEAGTDPPVLAQ